MKTTTVAKTKPVALVWDYSAIEHEAPVEIITAAAERIKLVFSKTLENIIEIGKLLNVVHENLPHGKWGDWLTVELGLSASSARNYLNAYHHRDEFRAVENWSAGAAFLLAGPSSPEGAIEAANQIAEAGEKVTTADAKQIVEDLPGITPADRDPAETATPKANTSADIDHDVDRTRQAPERASETQTDSRVELKLATALWAAAAKLCELNPGGAAIVLREAEKEATQFAELTLGDDGRPDRETLRSFLDGGRSR
jgi:hypothetical protein